MSMLTRNRGSIWLCLQLIDLLRYSQWYMITIQYTRLYVKIIHPIRVIGTQTRVINTLMRVVGTPMWVKGLLLPELDLMCFAMNIFMIWLVKWILKLSDFTVPKLWHLLPGRSLTDWGCTFKELYAFHKSVKLINTTSLPESLSHFSIFVCPTKFVSFHFLPFLAVDPIFH